MSDLILFWHRRDLRLRDNVGLAMARQHSSKVVGLFCLDPNILEREDVAPARVAYMMGSVQVLQANYEKQGGQLLCLRGDPSHCIPALAIALGATQVYWNRDIEPYAATRDRAVSDALQAAGVAVHAQWDQLLHAPGTILTGSDEPYKVYTPFWRNWIQQDKAVPCDPIQHLEPLADAEYQQAKDHGVMPLPTAKELGFSWATELFLAPGEAIAHGQLSRFCQPEGALPTYGEQRNYPAEAGTSGLSAALKFGTIGIRTVWQQVCEAKAAAQTTAQRESMQTWQQELAWREFYQHVLYFFPELANGPYREPLKAFPWVNNVDHFQAWCQGKTGYPIVDAAMRQLNQTGWMHNRCRMIVASFLTKDLIIDWRWGENYFMKTLIDGDLAANNGGWQWSASSGMDPKPLRIFNPASQAKKFDPEAVYIRRWLPEIRSVKTKTLVEGTLSVAECDRYHYPRPIVDHKIQQQQFKALYKEQKRKLDPGAAS